MLLFICPYLGSALWVLVVSRKDFEGDGHPVSPPVGTESVPYGSVDSVVDHIQTGQCHKGHGPAAQLRGKIPLSWTHFPKCRAAKNVRRLSDLAPTVYSDDNYMLNSRRLLYNENNKTRTGQYKCRNMYGSTNITKYRFRTLLSSMK